MYMFKNDTAGSFGPFNFSFLKNSTLIFTVDYHFEYPPAVKTVQLS